MVVQSFVPEHSRSTDELNRLHTSVIIIEVLAWMPHSKQYIFNPVHGSLYE